MPVVANHGTDMVGKVVLGGAFEGWAEIEPPNQVGGVFPGGVQTRHGDWRVGFMRRTAAD